MKSTARDAASLSCFVLDNGSNQSDTNVIPINPFCDACALNILKKFNNLSSVQIKTQILKRILKL